MSVEVLLEKGSIALDEGDIKAALKICPSGPGSGEHG